MSELETAIAEIVNELFSIETEILLTRPESQFGDFSTNIALQLSKELGQKPRDIATELANKLQTELADTISEVSVAGPGFINITIKDELIIGRSSTATNLEQGLAGKVIVTEYSDPNPFKVLHVGHLYDSVVGESIAKLQESAGATVHRVNFGGDVGLHVGKTMWAIIQELGGENPEKLSDIPEDQRAVWLSKQYIKGNNIYEDDAQVKEEIIALNKKIYDVHANDDRKSPFARIYWTTRQWSYDYFDSFYDVIGTKFEKYYPESVTAPVGLKTVKEQLAKGVFKESDGAVVFDGESEGLHTRVFINSNGLPTYEAKDIGLALCKWKDYQFDQTVIITGNDIVAYMKVILAALSKFEPEIAIRTTHITHGMVKMSGGVKMSSRKGNILQAQEVLDMATEAIKSSGREPDLAITHAAVKYAFLKSRLGGDIHFDIDESISLEGNSGPYLQYAHARACSILAKSSTKMFGTPANLDTAERTVVAKIAEFKEVVAKATQELSPHLICTYLYELTQEFNRFYEHNRVIDDSREEERLYLVSKYADVLKSGLGLLGIHAPERM